MSIHAGRVLVHPLAELGIWPCSNVVHEGEDAAAEPGHDPAHEKVQHPPGHIRCGTELHANHQIERNATGHDVWRQGAHGKAQRKLAPASHLSGELAVKRWLLVSKGVTVWRA